GPADPYRPQIPRLYVVLSADRPARLINDLSLHCHDPKCPFRTTGRKYNSSDSVVAAARSAQSDIRCSRRIRTSEKERNGNRPTARCLSCPGLKLIAQPSRRRRCFPDARRAPGARTKEGAPRWPHRGASPSLNGKGWKKPPSDSSTNIDSR